MSYTEGFKGEAYFRKVMLEYGNNVKFIDKYYDFLVNDKIKVEVKTCRLTVSNGNKQKGIYQFTRPLNRDLQVRNDVWVCFIVYHRDQFIIQGFVKAKNLHKKKYVSIISASKHHLKTLLEFIILCNES